MIANLSSIAPEQTAIYGRVSTDDKQNPRASRERQEDEIKQAFGGSIDLTRAQYFFDVGSGADPGRFEYQRMMKAARAGQIKLIIVQHFDRFGRDLIELLERSKELVRLGVQLRFATMPSIDPLDPQNKITVAVLFTLAEYEWYQISQRVKGGMRNKAQKGQLLGRAPDGYRNVKRTDDDGQTHSVLEIEPLRMEVIRLIFELKHKHDLSHSKICIKLEQLGHTRSDGQSYVNRNGQKRKDSNSTISRVLRNPTYCGLAWSKTYGNEYGLVRGDWEPIIEEALYWEVQKQLEKRNRGNGGKRTNYYLLENHLYYRTTDDQLVRMNCETPSGRKKPYSYYLLKKPHSIYLPCQEIDLEVVHQLQAARIDPDLIAPIRQSYRRHLKREFEKPRSERQTLLERLGDVAASLERTEDLYLEGRMSKDRYLTKTRQYEEKRANLQGALDACGPEMERYVMNLDHAVTIVEKMGILFERMSLQDQWALLHLISERLEVAEDTREVVIIWRPPFGYLNAWQRTLQPDVHMLNADAGQESKTGVTDPGSACFHEGSPNGASAHSTIPASRITLAKSLLLALLYIERDQTSVSTTAQRNTKIRARYEAGESLSDLARAFELSPQRIYQIVHNRRR